MGTTIKNYIKVKTLVEKGIMSPTFIMKQIPMIREWRTAKKYVDQATEELMERNDIDPKKTYSAMILNLFYLRNSLLVDMENKSNLNQKLGLIKQLLKVNEQLIKLQRLDISGLGITEKTIDFSVEARKRLEKYQDFMKPKVA